MVHQKVIKKRDRVNNSNNEWIDTKPKKILHYDKNPKIVKLLFQKNERLSIENEQLKGSQKDPSIKADKAMKKGHYDKKKDLSAKNSDLAELKSSDPSCLTDEESSLDESQATNKKPPKSTTKKPPKVPKTSTKKQPKDTKSKKQPKDPKS